MIWCYRYDLSIPRGGCYLWERDKIKKMIFFLFGKKIVLTDSNGFLKVGRKVRKYHKNDEKIGKDG
jgi:hypothetical protein